MDEKQVTEQLIYILDCYEGGKPLLSNQGQALDGYSALAEFVALAERAKRHLSDKSSRQQGDGAYICSECGYNWG